jgi:hypothetical protein
MDSYKFIPNNGDVLTLKMTSNAACRVLDTVSVSTSITVVPTVSPEVNIGASPNDTVCEFATATFVSSSSNGGPAPVYAWKVNGVYAGTGLPFSYLPANNDVVVCMMVSNATCRTTDTVYSNSVTMKVLPMLTPVVNISAVPGLTIVAGTSLTLTANVINAGPAPKYQWSVNGTPVAGATSATLVSTTFSNNDAVSCTVTSSGICGINTVKTVTITVIPTANGVKDQGIGASVQLVPNPNNGTFRILGLQSFNKSDLSVTVTDMIGQVVYSRIIAVNSSTDEIVQLNNTIANGMYILNIKSETDNKAMHFVIRR